MSGNGLGIHSLCSTDGLEEGPPWRGINGCHLMITRQATCTIRWSTGDLVPACATCVRSTFQAQKHIACGMLKAVTAIHIELPRRLAMIIDRHVQ